MPEGTIKLSLDLAIGQTSAIESSDKEKMSEISQKVRDLNGRLQDIRREQVFQRVSCFYYLDPFAPYQITSTSKEEEC